MPLQQGEAPSEHQAKFKQVRNGSGVIEMGNHVRLKHSPDLPPVIGQVQYFSRVLVKDQVARQANAPLFTLMVTLQERYLTKPTTYELPGDVRKQPTAADKSKYDNLFPKNFRQVKFPNRLNKGGTSRTRGSMLEKIVLI